MNVGGNTVESKGEQALSGACFLTLEASALLCHMGAIIGMKMLCPKKQPLLRMSSLLLS